MVSRWRIFGDFFGVLHFQTSNLRPLRLGEEKKKEEKEQTGQKYNVRICYAERP